VVLGGLLDSLDAVVGADEVMFGYTKPLIPGVVSPDPPIGGPSPTPMLILEMETIPEPSHLLLAALGLLTVAMRRRRS